MVLCVHIRLHTYCAQQKPSYCTSSTAESSHWALKRHSTLRIAMSHWLPQMVRTYRTIYWSSLETTLGIECSYMIRMKDLVRQGSVLGPILCNVMYDSVLRLKLPEDTQLIGFEDDIALLIKGKYLNYLVSTCNTAVGMVRSWILESRNTGNTCRSQDGCTTYKQ